MIVLYVLKGCPYCNNALSLLKSNNVKHKSIVVENNEEKELYKKQNGMNTFPQIFLHVNKDDYLKIGGYSDLVENFEMCDKIKKSSVSLDSIYYMYKNLNKK